MISFDDFPSYKPPFIAYFFPYFVPFPWSSIFSCDSPAFFSYFPVLYFFPRFPYTFPVILPCMIFPWFFHDIRIFFSTIHDFSMISLDLSIQKVHIFPCFFHDLSYFWEISQLLQAQPRPCCIWIWARGNSSWPPMPSPWRWWRLGGWLMEPWRFRPFGGSPRAGISQDHCGYPQ